MIFNCSRILKLLFLLVIFINLSTALSQTDTWVDETNIKNSTRIGIETIKEKGLPELISIVEHLYNEFDKKPDLRLLEKATVIDGIGLSFAISVAEKKGVHLEKISQYYSSVEKHIDRVKNRLTKLGYSEKEGDEIMLFWGQISQKEFERIFNDQKKLPTR